MSYLTKSDSKKKHKQTAPPADAPSRSAESLYSGANLNASAVKVPNKSMFGRRSGSR